MKDFLRLVPMTTTDLILEIIWGSAMQVSHFPFLLQNRARLKNSCRHLYHVICFNTIEDTVDYASFLKDNGVAILKSLPKGFPGIRVRI